ncbi:amino acid adenylation domain-containing protein [Streptomyces anandii]|uniref:Amino acid adenylation domain-containing protein n=1 Tax=Streptomyces anandii TaxID=285454 RepID=A0ABW6HEL8_9ACTN
MIDLTTFVRNVAPLEWAFLGITPELRVMNLLVEGEGAIPPHRLADAVAAAAHAHPGMRLTRQDERWTDSGAVPAVRTLEAGALDGARLEAPELRAPFDDTRATCEVLLAPGDPATVVFRADHAVTDGRGLLLWARDVFRALRGEDPLGAPADTGSEELLRQSHPDGEPPRAAARDLGFPSPLGPRPHERAGLLWRRRSLDGTHLAATAKVVAALAAAHGPGRFHVPVDLRRHLPGLRSTAALSHAVDLDVAEGEGWEDVQRTLLGRLTDRRDLAAGTDPGILGLPLPLLREGIADIDRTAAGADRHSARACVSHLGTVDPADFRADGFEAVSVYALGGVTPGGPPEIDVVELPGRTELTVAWYDGPGTADRAEALLDTVEEALSPRAHRHWEGNRTRRPLPDARSVVALFREQVARTPHRTALSGPEGEISYLELSRRADAVAAELRRLGAGPGTVVGLLAGRSAASVAGLWGVLRAGACYLPLDVRHPDRRLADLLTDAGSTLCLVERAQEGRDCLPEGCRALPLDALATGAAGEDGATAAEADTAVGPHDLAYVIYTSGSTGRPKGVQIEHGSLANYVHWATREFGIDSETCLPLLTSPSFDVSGTSVFLPLLTGGEVVLMRDDPNHLSLRHLLTRTRANTLNLTPSHLDLIGGLDIAPAGYRSVVVVGEQLRVEVAARAQEMFGPKCRIINLYGPTEATIGCTAHTYDEESDQDGSVVPIGWPADNTSVYLLDGERRFVAPGEVGEMYLGGAQLARGYLGRPELNRERFPKLADGTRVYRTGDLARVLPSGELQFVGRIDDQVKIRGHRVEPAEVARALEEHAAVDRAVVVTRPASGRGGKALYGYVLTNSPVSPDELRAHLEELLPAHMVPAAVTTVAELPYTVSGKVDVRALPDPFADERHGADGPPRTPGAADQVTDQAGDPVAEAVAGTWARTLGVDRSRLDGQSDFQRLGGDSLSLLAMLAGVARELLDARAEEAFMAELGRILREPTLERVTALVHEVRSEASSAV